MLPLNLDALLGKIAQLLDLQWQYKWTENALENKGSQLNKPKLGAEQYEALIAMAEIGYLSGFKNKFEEIKSEYRYPAGGESQIIEYVEVCNFPKIIEYLNELNDGS